MIPRDATVMAKYLGRFIGLYLILWVVVVYAKNIIIIIINDFKTKNKAIVIQFDGIWTKNQQNDWQKFAEVLTQF